MGIADTLNNMARLNPIALAEELYNDDGFIQDMMYNSVSVIQTDVIEAYGNAMQSPFFRVAILREMLRARLISSSDVRNAIPAVDLQAILDAMNIGSMSPKILGWAATTDIRKLNFAKDALAFIDLEILCDLVEHNKLDAEEYEYNRCGHRSMVIHPRTLWPEEKLRKWYDAYIEFYPKTPEERRDSIYSDVYAYGRFFNKLVEMYGAPDELYPIHEVKPEKTFSSYAFRHIESYCSAWEGNGMDFLHGDDRRIGMCVDLDLLSDAIKAKDSGKRYILHWLVKDYYTGESVRVRLDVNQLLCRDRLLPLAKAYEVYLKKQYAYRDRYEDEVYDPDLARYLEALPGSYENVFDYVMHRLPTPRDILEEVVSDQYADYASRMMPTGWEDFPESEIREAAMVVKKSIAMTSNVS